MGPRRETHMPHGEFVVCVVCAAHGARGGYKLLIDGVADECGVAPQDQHVLTDALTHDLGMDLAFEAGLPA